MIREIERDARRQHPRPLGARAVCETDPAARSKDSKRSKAPLIHTASAEHRRRFHEMRTTFELAYRAAARAIREQEPVHIPSNCFPPRPPFAPTGLTWPAPRPSEESEPQVRNVHDRGSHVDPPLLLSAPEPASLAQAPLELHTPTGPPFG
jgi:hypothetical protein